MISRPSRHVLTLLSGEPILAAMVFLLVGLFSGLSDEDSLQRRHGGGLRTPWRHSLGHVSNFIRHINKHISIDSVSDEKLFARQLAAALHGVK